MWSIFFLVANDRTQFAAEWLIEEFSRSNSIAFTDLSPWNIYHVTKFPQQIDRIVANWLRVSDWRYKMERMSPINMRKIHSLLAEHSWLYTIVEILTLKASYQSADIAVKFLVAVAEMIRQDKVLQYMLSWKRVRLESRSRSPVLIKKLAFIILKNIAWMKPLLIHELNKHAPRAMKKRSRTERIAAIQNSTALWNWLAAQ